METNTTLYPGAWLVITEEFQADNAKTNGLWQTRKLWPVGGEAMVSQIHEYGVRVERDGASVYTSRDIALRMRAAFEADQPDTETDSAAAIMGMWPDEPGHTFIRGLWCVSEKMVGNLRIESYDLVSENPDELATLRAQLAEAQAAKARLTTENARLEATIASDKANHDKMVQVAGTLLRWLGNANAMLQATRDHIETFRNKVEMPSSVYVALTDMTLRIDAALDSHKQECAADAGSEGG